MVFSPNIPLFHQHVGGKVTGFAMAKSVKATAPIPVEKVSIHRPGPHRAPKLVLCFNTVVCVFTCFYPWMVTHRSEGWTAYDMGLAYLVILAAHFAAHSLDLMTYDGGRTSVKIAGLFGYSPRKIILYTVFNHASTVALWVASVVLLAPSSEARVPDLAMLARFVVVVAASDVLFYYAHGRVLHNHLPSVHLLHHCCIFSSLSSNYIAVPIDAVIEFAAPVATVCGLLGTPFVPLMHDPFGLVVILAYVLAHASWFHDYQLGMDHTLHHKYVGGEYFLFSDLHFWTWGQPKQRKPADPVRDLIFSKINVVR
jgi:hypothetical protein